MAPRRRQWAAAWACALWLACRGARADTLAYAWDVSIVVTSIPAGTGRGVWQSPEPIVVSASHYWMTSYVAMTASLLPPLFGTWDSGEELSAEELSATNVPGPLSPLPRVLTDQRIVRTNLQRILLLVITSVASARAHVTIGTDSFIYSEISEFQITNLTMGGYTRVKLAVIGDTNDGRGVYLHAVPEAGLCGVTAWCTAMIGWRRAIRRRHDLAPRR